mgnify:CR=1 FL=1
MMMEQFVIEKRVPSFLLGKDAIIQPYYSALCMFETCRSAFCEN